jgi:hypothetical protein
MANTTWNPSDKSATITLSGTNNLIATCTSGAISTVRAIDKQITGKFYWEITATTVVTAHTYGAYSGSASLSAGFATGGGGSAGTCGVGQTGNILVDGTNTLINIGSFTSGAVICIAFDVGARLAWFRLGAAGNWNGSASANPATGTGGIANTLGDGIPLYPAISLIGNGSVSTANFGDTAFTGTVPSGFTSGFTSGVTSPTNALATQIAAEHWLTTNPQEQVTQLALEQWIVGWSTPAGGTQVLPSSRAGIGSAVVHESSPTNTYNVADVGVVRETAPIVVASVTLSDFTATSDIFGENLPVGEVLSDSVASGDTFSAAISYFATLSDTAVADGIFGVPIFVTMSDSAASSDAWLAREGYTRTLIDLNYTSDAVSLMTDFELVFTGNGRTSDKWSVTLQVGPVLECGPIPLFPPLPQGYPLKLSVVMDTTVGTTKSLREMRVAQQDFPLWDIELLFEELRDQTQNQTVYKAFTGLQQYEALVQTWLMMYGQTNLFAFDCPWDNSRKDQYIGVGDGTTTAFPVFRTWAYGSVATAAPVGLIGTVTDVKLNGVALAPSAYFMTRTFVNFVDPPAVGATITMTFGYYYVCRFVEDEQDFEEFSKNRWSVQSLKFRAVYWNGCE